MTVLPPAPSWTVLTLDTAGPRLTITSEGFVQPPDPLVVTVATDEPCSLAASFTDALGQVYLVGVEEESAGSFRLLLPTVGMASGGGMLRLRARDLAGNPTVIDWPVLVDRPRPFDLLASTTEAHETMSEHRRASDLVAAHSGPHSLACYHDGPHETLAEVSGPFQIISEVSRAV